VNIAECMRAKSDKLQRLPASDEDAVVFGHARSDHDTTGLFSFQRAGGVCSNVHCEDRNSTMNDIQPQTASNDGVAEFPDLLASTRQIEGSTVFNRDGDKLGTISSLIADTRTGQIEFAVLALGGFLGMGESQHPLPWHLLVRTAGHTGYTVDLDKRLLRGAPSYRTSDEPSYDEGYASRVSSYYSTAMPNS